MDKLVGYILGITIIFISIYGINYWYNLKLDESYSSGVISGKQEIADEYNEKAAQLQSQLAADREELENEAKERIAQANTDAESARNAANSLRKTLDRVRAIASSAGASVGNGETAIKAVNMLTNMLGESNDRANEYAKFADSAFEAGRLCENQYDKMRVKTVEKAAN